MNADRSRIAVVHEAPWVCPATSGPIRDGAIAVGDDGRIQHVGLQSELHAIAAPRIQHAQAAIVPGFVNAHTHLELTLFRGAFENLSFADWIRNLVRVKYQNLDRAALRISAQLGAVENLRAGVTAVGDVMDTGTAWEAVREFGLQGVIYQEVFGPDESVADESLRTLQENVSRCLADQTAWRRCGVSPHAPYSVSAKLYRETGAYARANGLPIAVHIAESREETAFLSDGTGPFAAALRKRGIAVEARGVTPVEYLERLGCLSPATLLIHAIEIDDADLERIHSSGAATVHCPKSNAKFAHRVARVGALRTRGIAVGLGTDSVASNNVVDMFEEMRCAVFHQRVATGRIDALDAHAAFRMATIDGARCLGLDGDLGSLEPGKRADFAIVDLGGLPVRPVYDPVETMVYSASHADVRGVYIGGKAVDLPDECLLLEEATAIATRLRAKL